MKSHFVTRPAMRALQRQYNGQPAAAQQISSRRRTKRRTHKRTGGHERWVQVFLTISLRRAGRLQPRRHPPLPRWAFTSSSIGDHRVGLVRRAGSTRIGARWARVQHGRFLNLFMLLTFAYAMVNYYDTSIPGLGFSIKGFIDGGTINLVNLIGSDGSTTMLSEIHAASSKTGPSMLNSVMFRTTPLCTLSCSFS